MLVCFIDGVPNLFFSYYKTGSLVPKPLLRTDFAKQKLMKLIMQLRGEGITPPPPLSLKDRSLARYSPEIEGKRASERSRTEKCGNKDKNRDFIINLFFKMSQNHPGS